MSLSNSRNLSTDNFRALNIVSFESIVGIEITQFNRWFHKNANSDDFRWSFITLGIHGNDCHIIETPDENRKSIFWHRK